MHGRRLAGVLLATAAVLIAPAGASAASSPFGGPCQVSGTALEGDFTSPDNLAIHGHTTPDNPYGNQVTDDFYHQIFLSGGLSGVGNAHETDVENIKTLHFVGRAVIDFPNITVTCSNGQTATGGLVIKFVVTGHFNPDGSATTGTFTGHFEVLGSSGGLAGTTGSGTLSGEPGVPGGHGPFSGTLH